MSRESIVDYLDASWDAFLQFHAQTRQFIGDKSTNKQQKFPVEPALSVATMYSGVRYSLSSVATKFSIMVIILSGGVRRRASAIYLLEKLSFHFEFQPNRSLCGDEARWRSAPERRAPRTGAPATAADPSPSPSSCPSSSRPSPSPRSTSSGGSTGNGKVSRTGMGFSSADDEIREQLRCNYRYVSQWNDRRDFSFEVAASFTSRPRYTTIVEISTSNEKFVTSDVCADAANRCLRIPPCDTLT
jgi:hypothetical protein